MKPFKVNAAARLKAGWFDSLSDVAKKAYLKLHPNSKQGKSSQPSAPSGVDSAKKAFDKAKADADAMHKRIESKGGEASDAEWAAYDKLQERKRKAGEAYRKMKGT